MQSSNFENKTSPFGQRRRVAWQQMHMCTIVLLGSAFALPSRRFILAGMYTSVEPTLASYHISSTTLLTNQSDFDGGARPSWSVAHPTLPGVIYTANEEPIGTITTIDALQWASGRVTLTRRAATPRASGGGVPVQCVAHTIVLVCVNHGSVSYNASRGFNTSSSVSAHVIDPLDGTLQPLSNASLVSFGIAGGAHGIALLPLTGRRLAVFVVSFGLDAVFTFTLDLPASDRGILKGGAHTWTPRLRRSGVLRLPRGSHPRHIALLPGRSKQGRAYLALEGGGEAHNGTHGLVVLALDPVRGTLAALPPPLDVPLRTSPLNATGLFPSEVLVLPQAGGDDSGQLEEALVLIATRDITNKSRDSVAVFRVHELHAPVHMMTTMLTSCSYPRSFAPVHMSATTANATTSSSSLLVVGCQNARHFDANATALYSLDHASGALTLLDRRVAPASVAFVGEFTARQHSNTS